MLKRILPYKTRLFVNVFLVTVVMVAAAMASASAFGRISDEPGTDQSEVTAAVLKAAESFDRRFDLERFFGRIETEDDVHTIARGATKDVLWDELTAADFIHLGRTQLFRRLPPELETKARNRGQKLAALPGRDGAIGTLVVAMLEPREQRPHDAQQRINLLQHEGLAGLLQTPLADRFFWLFSSIHEGVADELRPHLLRAAELIGPETHLKSAPSVARLYEGLHSIATAKELDHLRPKILAYLEAARAHVDENDQQAIDNASQFLLGAYGRRELIGHPLPPLTILWSSDESISSLDDLRGKIVVLDFGATWCGPCIAAFPKKKALHERYKDDGVVTVWVTSVQGYHVTGDGRRIFTQGEPEREFALMKEFIAHYELPGLVIFTKEPVTNIDFGVSGIPHVAIIDSQGRTRFNKLHPHGSHEQIVMHVDTLLAEATAEDHQ